MKKIILFIALFGLVSCNSSILDKEFSYEFYERLDYKNLVKATDVSKDDLFLIHYSILRQRDYFNYTVEGKTYREILEMAKSFKINGFPAEFTLTDNSKQDKIQQKAAAEGVGYARKGNTKKVLKTLNFSCTIENPTDKDVVLLNSSFIVKGPFGDYLTTVNYEINCILQAKKTVIAGCVVSGKTIKQNLLFEGNPYIQRIGDDEVISNLEVIPSGLSYQDEGRYFKDCFFNAARIEPHNIVDFSKDLKDKDWKVALPDGTFSLNMGNMHIPDEKDEVIEMR